VGAGIYFRGANKRGAADVEIERGGEWRGSVPLRGGGVPAPHPLLSTPPLQPTRESGGASLAPPAAENGFWCIVSVKKNTSGDNFVTHM